MVKSYLRIWDLVTHYKQQGSIHNCRNGSSLCMHGTVRANQLCLSADDAKPWLPADSCRAGG